MLWRISKNVKYTNMTQIKDTEGYNIDMPIFIIPFVGPVF